MDSSHWLNYVSRELQDRDLVSERSVLLREASINKQSEIMQKLDNTRILRSEDFSDKKDYAEIAYDYRKNLGVKEHEEFEETGFTLYKDFNHLANKNDYFVIGLHRYLFGFNNEGKVVNHLNLDTELIKIFILVFI
jgi:hypothetical protein